MLTNQSQYQQMLAKFSQSKKKFKNGNTCYQMLTNVNKYSQISTYVDK